MMHSYSQHTHDGFFLLFLSVVWHRAPPGWSCFCRSSAPRSRSWCGSCCCSSLAPRPNFHIHVSWIFSALSYISAQHHMTQNAHLVGLASAAVLPHDQEAGAGADAARDPPAVPLHKILSLTPFEGIQGACDDKSLALQALGMPPRRLLQQPGCAQKVYIFPFFWLMLSRSRPSVMTKVSPCRSQAVL